MDTKGATESLREIIKDFDGDNEVNLFISERGNQRIEIIDKSTGEKWQTLECAQSPEKGKENDYDDICAAMLNSLFQQMNNTKEN